MVGKGITENHSLFFFVFITTSVGVIPTFFLIYIIEKNLARKNQLIAANFTENSKSKKDKSQNTIINLVSKNNDETITIDLKQLICVKSEGNYLKVYYLEENIATQKLIRNSISKVEKQLIIFEQIKRCHRSFLVNLDKVEKMTGNARSLNLHISDIDFTIPVSRSFPKEIFKEFNI